MKRKCNKYDIGAFLKAYPDFSKSNVEIWIDKKNAQAIKNFLTSKKKNGEYKHQKRFKVILWRILSNQYEKEVYRSEKMSEKSKNVTAMKFQGKANPRIYCKEIFIKGKKIVMVVIYSKKVQKNDKRIKNLLETIGGYEYEF